MKKESVLVKSGESSLKTSGLCPVRALVSGSNCEVSSRVAAHHFKVYICGSRNGIVILNSDKTLICLRNACHFIESPIRQKGRSFFVNTNPLFDEIIEQMAMRIGCINDSQWRIGGFLTNCSSPKKILGGSDGIPVSDPSLSADSPLDSDLGSPVNQATT